ncbi:helix-turn-helix transcriptional regulator [Bacillus sp. Bva_UNVM-123]|uniref:helix-turn-helix transcriptional regulator n=1 Tax=Bacillus sp. Bva_UNVM-123 TaxID=2829798 RepID=UPI00391F5B5C
MKPRLKVRLAELNIKQQDLCKKLGVTKQTLNAWVNGRATPTLEMSFKIANLLDCKVDDLFTYIEETE